MFHPATETSFRAAERDYLTDRRGAERAARCACCGCESTDLDWAGRCPGEACALASRIDAEVPTAIGHFVLRASRLAFETRRTRRDAALDAVAAEGEADLPALPFERTWTRRDALKAVGL